MICKHGMKENKRLGCVDCVIEEIMQEQNITKEKAYAVIASLEDEGCLTTIKDTKGIITGIVMEVGRR